MLSRADQELLRRFYLTHGYADFQVLSAEGRLSAIILGALPLLFVAYLVLVRPEYIGLLVTTPLGIMMIVDALARSAGGKARNSIARPTGVSIPPPTPCTTRKAIS